jgi:rhamnulokinase
VVEPPVVDPVETPGFVAVDLGATSGRVMLGVVRSCAGSRPPQVELVECGRFANGPVTDQRGALRWDVRALWRGILDGLRSAAEVARERGVEIRGIGVDSWAVDHGFLDAAGDLVADPFCYRDLRTDGTAGEVYRRISFADHYAVNGLQDLPFTTEFQLVAGRGDAEWARADQLLLIPDLIGYWLTGRRVAEVTNASTTGLLDARSRTWSADLLDRLAAVYPELAGLRDRLPELVEPGTAVGQLVPEVREATGLGEVPVFAVASHDTASAVAATPLPKTAGAYISSGTWSLVGLELLGPRLTEGSRAANFTNELGLDGTVRYLRNVMGLWVLDECLRAWEESGDPVDRAALLDAAAAEPPSAVLLDVDGDELLAPGDMPRRVADAVVRAGGDSPASRAALARVVLDSLAAAYARVIGEASDLADVEVGVVHVVGGGSQNQLLCRLTAEATGLPVIAGPAEATALGNVLVQARAAGVLGLGQGLADLRGLVVASTRPHRYDAPGQGRSRDPDV